MKGFREFIIEANTALPELRSKNNSGNPLPELQSKNSSKNIPQSTSLISPPEVKPKLSDNLKKLKQGIPTAGSRSLGGLALGNAYLQAKQGDYPGAAISAGLGGELLSKRFSQGVQNISKKVITKPLTSAATRIGGKPLGKVASRFVPGFQQLYAAKETQERLAKKDYGGAAYSALSGIPGPVGLVATIKDVERTIPLSKKQQDYKDALLSGDTGKINKQLASQRTSQERQKQAQAKTPGTIAGSGIRGAGGQSFVTRTPKGAAFVSTGVGKQRKTSQLPSQMLLPSGKVGDLAFKDGRPTYLARPSVEQTKQNPLQRLARSTNLFGYADKEKSQQAQDVSRAAASTRSYYRKLGITPEKQQQLNPAIKPVTPKPPVKVSGKLK